MNPLSAPQQPAETEVPGDAHEPDKKVDSVPGALVPSARKMPQEVSEHLPVSVQPIDRLKRVGIEPFQLVVRVAGDGIALCDGCEPQTHFESI